MKNLVTISNELMNNIASYMDDDLREDTHFAVAPCSNEVFITEYYNTASAELKRVLEGILSDEFNLDINDIIYSAYYQVYNNLTITEEDLDELQSDYNVINILPMNSVFAHKKEKSYIIRMVSGDLTVFCQGGVNMNNSVYLKVIRSSIRTALKMRLSYYEFNWYLLGTKNGYRYTNNLPTPQEIDYAARLIDKVSDALLSK